MEPTTTRHSLPDCKIISTLIKKSNAKTDYEFDYVGELEQFRKIVSIEVSRINLLFPEYTPHDELYHLKRLFYVADQLLGDELIENMNVTELFLLSASLYGHDWGMAISEDEKNNIVQNLLPTPESSVALLDDEQLRLNDFLKSRSIDKQKFENVDWQEYIRTTHAFRSGKRIKKYFEFRSPGIAEFASRICIGHWLDFEFLDDHDSYPTDASIHREIVNIKALTIYVRLIDLLDLGEDRTPFVLWKFVAPRNQFSKLEWEKHRSLQPVTFPKYQLGRAIQVDGSTEDHGVFMSILDLKRYVNDQFRHCSDILNRINHGYHNLNISHIDWRISARGFEPVAIQFEFDRNRMFDILSDEIYQSNPYVFIRELIQNAIDAIEMRQRLLEKIDITFKPSISIKVTEASDIYIVEISDNGIGMDEYVIRNYLSKAGKSYYISNDFKKEGLKMDPISRFGIGVLSCFMVADVIEIETFKDPNTTHSQEHFEISIPAKQNYFKVKKNNTKLNIGTKFKVYVLKSKLPIDRKTKKTIPFNIIEYVSKIAGFAKYPITVSENHLTRVVYNPNTLKSYPEDVSLEYSFPLTKAFFPQDLPLVNELFIEKQIHLKDDLKLNGFDGCLTFLMPKSNTLDIATTGYSWPTNDVTIIDYSKRFDTKIKLKWIDAWSSYSRHFDSEKYLIPEKSYRVFMNGILVQDVNEPNIQIGENRDRKSSRYYFTTSFVTPQLFVNLQSHSGIKIDVARTNFETEERWDRPIWEALLLFVKQSTMVDVITKPIKEQFLLLGRLITFYRFSYEMMINLFQDETPFPMPFLSSEGKILFRPFNRAQYPIIRLTPLEIGEELSKLFYGEFFQNESYSGMIKGWDGDDLIAFVDYHDRPENYAGSLGNAQNLVNIFIREHYFTTAISFVSSFSGIKYPFATEILHQIPAEISIKRAFDAEEIELLDFINLNNDDLFYINGIIDQHFYSFPKIVFFKTPMESKSFYARIFFNVGSSKIQRLITICLHIIRAKECDEIPKEISGKLFDMFNDLYFVRPYYLKDNVRFTVLNSTLKEIQLLMEKSGLLKISREFLEFDITDFVDNTVVYIKKGNSISFDRTIKSAFKANHGWGFNI